MTTTATVISPDGRTTEIELSPQVPNTVAELLTRAGITDVEGCSVVVTAEGRVKQIKNTPQALAAAPIEVGYELTVTSKNSGG